MSTALRRKLIALLSAAALCVAVPGAALANQGGTPNSNAKGCKSKVHGNGPTKDAPNGKGKKCGFKKHN